MAKPLTPKQRAVFAEIEKRTEAVCNATVRELAAVFGIRNPTGMHCHLRALERKGLIKRAARGKKGIRILKRPEE